ncbi:zinc-binding dehydrogenase [Nannocystis bainbridge]|uniref:Zinc-binding dehydrogenase n=1 Tax=Nannocystis bainbridge TaxID=2995303 RepID=A0ABT5E501_9BACT|nr:zinc-binding dehydrogenase [Nannocystis bainbridge]MDC0720414.1 zinc-binding dehydrogenase [Nannocystis bainbridge]
MIETEAWVLYERSGGSESALDSDDFRRETFAFPGPAGDELLVEPLFGSWEGNMTHSLQRRPIDICKQRGERRVVIGNGSVLRVLRAGADVRGIHEGDVGILHGGHVQDEFGYTVLVQGYDAPGTVGVLAKRTKIAARNFLPLPLESHHRLEQWAAFSVRYLTAWSNYHLALGAYRLQVNEPLDPAPFVLGWGGGSTLAALDLARRAGCRAAMVSGSPQRLAELARMGIVGIDRRAFAGLEFDEGRYASDPEYHAAYRAAERAFLAAVHDWTGGRGAAIVFDYIGAPVFRASVKALGRQGVLATAGWLLGMQTTVNRAIECIGRHVHVHSHYIRRADSPKAMRYAEREGWMPQVSEIYSWEEIGGLARAAAAGRLRSYFPVYRVNPV